MQSPAAKPAPVRRSNRLDDLLISLQEMLEGTAVQRKSA